MRELSPLSCQDPQLSCPVLLQPWAALWVFWHCTVRSKIIFFSFSLELAALLPPTTTVALLSKRNLLLPFHEFSASVVWQQSACSSCCCCRHPALSWASHNFSHPSSVWLQNLHFPSAFVSLLLKCFLDTSCNPAAVSRWFISLFLVSWHCPLTGLCYLREGYSQFPPNQVAGPDCCGGSLLPASASTWGACIGVLQLVSTWMILWWTELSSLLLSRNLLWRSCHSLGCVCIHCKVVSYFQNTVGILAWKAACARACFPLVPTGSHCSEPNGIWRMCLGSARTR